MKTIKQALQILKSKLGEHKIITDSDILEKYSKDETPDLSFYPDVLIRVESANDVSQTLAVCNEYKIPVTPRGAGTGVTGGSVPVKAGIVLSLEKMNRILEIDRDNMVAIVEPGVITGDIQHAVRKYGLMYPPDPASLDSCSIGGNVAENAGGPQAVKYGTTKDYILGLEFVLPNGQKITAGGKTVKNATGYNLCGLLTGSEGTLAVITKIFLKLIPYPKIVNDLLIPYETMDEAADSVCSIFKNSIIPSTIEFMEEDAIKLVSGHLDKNIPFPDARAHLLIQLHANSEESMHADLEAIMTCLHTNPENIYIAKGSHQRERLWKARRSIREAIKIESPVFLSEDCVVPRAEIPSFLKLMKIYFSDRKLRSIMFGHAGDGNVHVNILKDRMSYELWKNIIPEIKREMYRQAINLGGTITGEHGIGYVRRRYINMALTHETIDVFKKIKKALDPNNILNPSKIF